MLLLQALKARRKAFIAIKFGMEVADNLRISSKEDYDFAAIADIQVGEAASYS